MIPVYPFGIHNGSLSLCHKETQCCSAPQCESVSQRDWASCAPMCVNMMCDKTHTYICDKTSHLMSEHPLRLYLTPHVSCHISYWHLTSHTSHRDWASSAPMCVNMICEVWDVRCQYDVWQDTHLHTSHITFTHTVTRHTPACVWICYDMQVCVLSRCVWIWYVRCEMWDVNMIIWCAMWEVNVVCDKTHTYNVNMMHLGAEQRSVSEVILFTYVGVMSCQICRCVFCRISYSHRDPRTETERCSLHLGADALCRARHTPTCVSIWYVRCEMWDVALHLGAESNAQSLCEYDMWGV